MKDNNNEKRKLFFEKNLPVIISILITLVFIVIALYYKIENIKIIKIEFLLNIIVTIVTTIIGFLLTGLTIIMSMMQTKVMRVIRKNQGENLLSRYIISPIVCGFILIINILIIGYLIDNENNVNIIMLTSVLFFIIIFIVETVRISFFMKKIFIIMSQEYSTGEKKENIKNAQSNRINFINK